MGTFTPVFPRTLSGIVADGVAVLELLLDKASALTMPLATATLVSKKFRRVFLLIMSLLKKKLGSKFLCLWEYSKNYFDKNWIKITTKIPRSKYSGSHLDATRDRGTTLFIGIHLK
jgi:hypothetical protein